MKRVYSEFGQKKASGGLSECLSGNVTAGQGSVEKVHRKGIENPRRRLVVLLPPALLALIDDDQTGIGCPNMFVGP